MNKHLFLEFIVERTDFDEPVRQYKHDVRCDVGDVGCEVGCELGSLVG